MCLGFQGDVHEREGGRERERKRERERDEIERQREREREIRVSRISGGKRQAERCKDSRLNLFGT